LPGLQPKAFEHRKVGGQADRKGREDEVERDGEGELYARKQQSRFSVRHAHFPSMACALEGMQFRSWGLQ
jgi:hypothetical protein